LKRAVNAADHPIRAMLILAGWCGLRCAEIAGLCREDVLDTHDPPFLLIHGKGRKDRLVGLGPAVLDELKAAGMPRSGPIFTRKDGGVGANAPHRISQMLNRFLHDSGIEASAHQLRHRLATVALRESHDLTCVAQILGHSSISSTQIYAAFDNQAAYAVTVAVQAALLAAAT
jgi:integrase/recombinase XerC